jgi:DNA-binding CsgD family transcriptional regulator
MRARTSGTRLAHRATDREIGVVAAVLVSWSEKAAAHRLGLSHSTVKHHLANARSKVGAATTAQLVWILAPRLPEPEGSAGVAQTRGYGAAEADGAPGTGDAPRAAKPTPGTMRPTSVVRSSA